MKKSEFIAVSAMTEPGTISWFQKHSKFPHYGERGVNTGISLMNLTRMRLQNFEDLIFKVRKNYEHLRPAGSGDQFLQNILYSFHPGKLVTSRDKNMAIKNVLKFAEFVSLFPCDWNLRPLHCNCKNDAPCACASAIQNGVAVIHATKSAFTNNVRLPLFRSIFNIFTGVSTKLSPVVYIKSLRTTYDRL